MPTVLLALADAAEGVQLSDALEAAGHAVTWVSLSAVVPANHRATDVVVMDAEECGARLPAIVAAWRAFDPPPALVAFAGVPAARAAAEKLHLRVVAKPVATAALLAEIGRAAELRLVSGLTPGSALALVGVPSSGDPEQDAMLVIVRARAADAAKIKEALRVHADDYVAPTARLEPLRTHHALAAPEVELLRHLDGATTVRRLVGAGLLEAAATARLLWALASVGAVTLSRDPPADAPRTTARRVEWLRRTLRARRERVQRARSFYDILEVTPDTAPRHVDRACHLLALWYAPDALAAVDLGDLATLPPPLWHGILQARATLVDLEKRHTYNYWLVSQHVDLREQQQHWARAADAEAMFQRGQEALAAGEVFQGVSALAQAARLAPDEPDYEAYLGWARYLSEVANGKDQLAAARKECAVVEQALLGRCPRARALFALGLLSQVAQDLVGARLHFGEALTCDPSMAAAQKALARLEYRRR